MLPKGIVWLIFVDVLTIAGNYSFGIQLWLVQKVSHTDSLVLYLQGFVWLLFVDVLTIEAFGRYLEFWFIIGGQNTVSFWYGLRKNSSKMAFTSLLNTYSVIINLHMLQMCAWMSAYHVFAALVGQVWSWDGSHIIAKHIKGASQSLIALDVHMDESLPRYGCSCWQNV